jgi:hypothetical protein
MNVNPVVSADAAVDLSGKEYVGVKLTSAGIDIAGAADRRIGTLLRGAVAGAAVAVHLDKANGIQFAKIGTSTALTRGDELEQGANGVLNKKSSGTAVALAWETQSNTDGAVVRVLPI